MTYNSWLIQLFPSSRSFHTVDHRAPSRLRNCLLRQVWLLFCYTINSYVRYIRYCTLYMFWNVSCQEQTNICKHMCTQSLVFGCMSRCIQCLVTMSCISEHDAGDIHIYLQHNDWRLFMLNREEEGNDEEEMRSLQFLADVTKDILQHGFYSDRWDRLRLSFVIKHPFSRIFTQWQIHLNIAELLSSSRYSHSRVSQNVCVPVLSVF